jgi:hypothetical protein
MPTKTTATGTGSPTVSRLSTENFGRIGSVELTPQQELELKLWIFEMNRNNRSLLVRRSKDGDFRSGWSPIHITVLSPWDLRWRRLKQIAYDLTHRTTCMCSKCNQVVDNTGCHWSYPLGIQIASFYFPDHCPHCGD